MKYSVKILAIVTSICAVISSIFGLFYSYGGTLRTVKNIYEQDVVLFGDGIYANNSLLKVGATKGTDVVILLAALLLLITILFYEHKAFSRLLCTGLLSCLLYSSACLSFGVSFNRLFLLYLIQFSSALFAFTLSLTDVAQQDYFQSFIYENKHKGIALLLFIGGCSVLIWLTIIIPALLTSVPKFIEIYTTEPTFVIDLGIIFPICIWCGISLLKQKKIAYILASVLMTLVTYVGFCVIGQTVMQMRLGIILNAGQLVGMVLSFVILGGFAIYLNIKLLNHAKS